MKPTLYFIFFSLIFSSLTHQGLCQNKDQVVLLTPTPTQINTDFKNYIFLNFHIQKTAAKPNGIATLTGYKVIPGKTKQFLAPHQSQGKKGQLLVTLKNTTGTIVSQTIIDNPMEKEVEYPNENGQLGSVTVSQPEASFSVRLPYSSDCIVSEIKIFGDNQNLTEISSLTITNN